MISHFLEFTKGKIFLGFTIMFVHVVSTWYSASAMLCTTNCPLPNKIQIFLSPTIYPFGIVKLIGEVFEDVHIIPETVGSILTVVLSMTVLFFFWYFLSCVLVTIYSSSKKQISKSSQT